MPDTKPATDEPTRTDARMKWVRDNPREAAVRLELAEAALRTIEKWGGEMPARAWEAVIRWRQATNNTPGDPEPQAGAVQKDEAGE